jgi:hypothetical protein
MLPDKHGFADANESVAPTKHGDVSSDPKNPVFFGVQPSELH